MNELNYSQVLTEALTEFGKGIQSCRIDEGKLPWCPMMPYVYPEYGYGKKIFYVGQDTFGWNLKLPEETKENCFDFFFKCYDERRFDSYLEHNAGALSLDCRVYGWPNKPGSFWFGVNSLHLKLSKGRDPYDGLRDLSDDELMLLNGIGYGNLNSIELPETLQKGDNNYWPGISKDEYWRIKDSSIATLDKLRHLLEAFRPDCVVITAWGTKSEAEYFDGCDVSELAVDDGAFHGGMEVRSYLVSYKGQSTRVFWTKHPTHWGWGWDNFSANVNDLANYINSSMGW